MPSYNGEAIFGRAVEMVTADNPSADQTNAFFGANGLESLYGGQRGRQTLVKGVHFGSSAGDLKSVQLLFSSYNDGIARTLVDSYGYPYRAVKYGSFTPTGRIMRDKRGFFQAYQATFNHLI